MRVIGLTGGIATGKSTVATFLARLGATVVDADAEAHQAMRAGTAVFRAIVQEFGPEVVGEDGEIDRRALGRRVFADPDALARLNALVHPAVRQRLLERVEAAKRRGERAIVLEVPLLYESGFSDLVDEVWLVDADASLQEERLRRLRGLSQEEARLRIRAQLPGEVKRRLAHVVIDNRGDLASLARRVAELWHDRVLAREEQDP